MICALSLNFKYYYFWKLNEIREQFYYYILTTPAKITKTPNNLIIPTKQHHRLIV